MSYTPSTPQFVSSANVDIISFAPASHALITTDGFTLSSSDNAILIAI